MVSIRDDTEDKEKQLFLLWGKGVAKGNNHPLYTIKKTMTVITEYITS
jgi:hypothetical protein